MLSMSRRARSHAVRNVRAAACAALAALLAPLAATAADGEIVLPLYELPAGTRLQSDRTAAQAVPDRSNGSASRATAMNTGRPTSSFALVEMPPEASMPGSGYKRPHHAIGYRWRAAESWMRDHGFDAQTCFLPMVRMHTKIAAGNSAGTLWVYGRCTFR